MVVDAGARRRDQLSALLERYWGPIRGYVRALGWDQPEDLTQDFVGWVLESDFLARADRERGRFRAFVKIAVKRFLIDEARRRASAKRGGGRLRALAEEPPAASEPPAEALDRAWRAQLIEGALSSLEDGYRCEGREAVFAVFRAWYVDDAPTNHALLAMRHGVPQTTISNWLRHAKGRFREVLRQRVLDTVHSPEALVDELAWLVEVSGR